MNLNHAFIAICLFMSFNGFNQNFCDVKIVIPVQTGFEIRVDNDSIYTQKKLSLIEGKHIIEIWIPGIDLIIDTINVYSDSINFFSYTPKISQEYKSYKKSMNLYNGKKVVNLLPSVTAIGGGSFSLLFYLKARSLNKDFYNLKSTYSDSKSTYELIVLDEDLHIINDNYLAYKNKLKIALVFTGISAAFYLLGKYFLKDLNKKPEATYLNSPFLIRNSSLGFNEYGFTFKYKL